MHLATRTQRQIAIATVVAAKERTFLVLEQRIVDRIEVEPDLARHPRMRFDKQLD